MNSRGSNDWLRRLRHLSSSGAKGTADSYSTSRKLYKDVWEDLEDTLRYSNVRISEATVEALKGLQRDLEKLMR